MHSVPVPTSFRDPAFFWHQEEDAITSAPRTNDVVCAPQPWHPSNDR